MIRRNFSWVRQSWQSERGHKLHNVGFCFPQHVSHTDVWATFSRNHTTGFTVFTTRQVRLPGAFLPTVDLSVHPFMSFSVEYHVKQSVIILIWTVLFFALLFDTVSNYRFESQPSNVHRSKNHTGDKKNVACQFENLAYPGTMFRV